VVQAVLVLLTELLTLLVAEEHMPLETAPIQLQLLVLLLRVMAQAEAVAVAHFHGLLVIPQHQVLVALVPLA
jgi:hypothetical protein